MTGNKVDKPSMVNTNQIIMCALTSDLFEMKGLFCQKITDKTRLTLKQQTYYFDMVFQIIEDALDVISDEATISMSVVSDVSTNKSAEPEILCLDMSKNSTISNSKNAIKQLSILPDESSYIKYLAEYFISREYNFNWEHFIYIIRYVIFLTIAQIIKDIQIGSKIILINSIKTNHAITMIYETIERFLKKLDMMKLIFVTKGPSNHAKVIDYKHKKNNVLYKIFKKNRTNSYMKDSDNLKFFYLSDRNNTDYYRGLKKSFETKIPVGHFQNITLNKKYYAK